MKTYRHELKFILNKTYAQILKHRLAMIMEVDKNSINQDNTYFIRSLYFDDVNNSAYYEKVDGVEKRKKYRIRIYNLDDSFIRLERKDKDRDMTHKAQTKITKETYQKIIDNNLNDIDLTDELLNEFVTAIKTKGLKPAVVVDYQRLAYTYPLFDTRVTFDENIKSGRFNNDLFSDNYMTYDVLNDNETVLEVKFNEILPSHIASVIMNIPTVKQAISKFALCYEKKEI